MHKILIVDDEPMLIHGLCSQIDWESYNIELAGTAENGEIALSILEQKNIDILFTDVRMPKMDGLTLISEAKKHNPFLRSVVISSYSDFDYVKKSLLLEVENYLLKPIDQNELDKTLEKTIANLDRDRISILQDESGLSDFKSNILDRWVHGEIQDYQFYERAELLHINLSAPWYQLCVIDIIDSSTESQKLLHAQLLFKKCRDYFFSDIEGECFIDRSNRVVIVFYGDELNRRQDQLKQIFNKVSADLSTRGVKLFACIGSASDSAESVAHDYAEAVSFLNYRFIVPGVDFVLYGELLREFDRLGCKPALIQFAQSLSSNELLTTLNIANEFLDTASIYPVDTVKKCMIPFLTTLVKQIKESGHTSGSMSSAAIKEFAAMKTINSMGSLEKWFLDIIDQSLELINNRKESFHLLVRRTLDIIRKDYNHTDLSLKRIASNLKVTPAYLGQLFKEETGKYFNDYLTEIRLQESRILLLETDLKIRDILYRIGISNQSYFNRIFKKAYGMSPLDFRYQK
mgnify:CR=1 FL=1